MPSNSESPRKAFLIERKSYSDLLASQRCEADQTESRLDSQLMRLRDATEYVGRLLIVEAPDNDWRSDNTPDEYSDPVGVKRKSICLYKEVCSISF